MKEKIHSIIVNEYFQKCLKVLQTFQKYIESLRSLNNAYIYITNKYILNCNNIVQALNNSFKEIYLILENSNTNESDKSNHEKWDFQFENIVILFQNIISYLKESRDFNISIDKLKYKQNKKKENKDIIVLSRVFVNNNFSNEYNFFALWVEEEYLYVITKKNTGAVYDLNNGKCEKTIQNDKEIMNDDVPSFLNLISILDVKSLNLVKETISQGTLEYIIWNIIYDLKGLKNIICINPYVYNEIINNKLMSSIVLKNNMIESNNDDNVINGNEIVKANVNQNQNLNLSIENFNNFDRNQLINSLKNLTRERADFENSLKNEWKISLDDLINYNINSLKSDIENYDQQIKIQSNNYSENIKSRNNLLSNLQNMIMKSNVEYEEYDNKINEIKDSINELNSKQQELEVKINNLNNIDENNQENINSNNLDNRLNPEDKIENLKKLDQLQNMFLSNNRQIFKLNKTRISYLENQDNIEKDLFAKTLELRQNQTKVEKEIARFRTEIYSTVFLHIKFELALYYKIIEILENFGKSINYNSTEFINCFNLLDYSIKTRRVIELNFNELFKKELQIMYFSMLNTQRENILVQIDNLQKNYENTKKEYSTFSKELIPQKKNYNYQKDLIENKLKELLQKINDLENEYHPEGDNKPLSEEEEHLLSLKFQPLEQDVLAYMEKQKLYECEIKRLDRVQEKYNYRSLTLKEELISTKIKLEVINSFEQVIQSDNINRRNDLDNKCLKLIKHIKDNLDVDIDINKSEIGTNSNIKANENIIKSIDTNDNNHAINNIINIDNNNTINSISNIFDLELPKDEEESIIFNDVQNHNINININNLSFLSYASENINKHVLSINLNDMSQNFDSSVFNISNNLDEKKEEKAKAIISNINELKKEILTMHDIFESLCKILTNKQDIIDEKININGINNKDLIDINIKEKYSNLCSSLSINKEKYSTISNQIEHMVSQSNGFNVPLETQLRKLHNLKEQIYSVYNQIIDKKNNKKEFYEKLYMLDIKLFNFEKQKMQLNKALININNQYEYENNQLESHLAAVDIKLNEIKTLDFNNKDNQEENNLKSIKEQLKIQQNELKNDMITIEKQSSEENKMLKNNIDEIQNEYINIEKTKNKYSKKEFLQKIKELTEIYEKNSISMANQIFVLDSEQQERIKINSELNKIINKLNEYTLLFEEIDHDIINNKNINNSVIKEDNNDLKNSIKSNNIISKNNMEDNSFTMSKNGSEIKGIL
ncbi:hypothetical protein LY90DRAFT_666662 [Neocallimastix californiae]|uniref:Uncharacterized protein n=1 Tax=Neocallimastix californiae TaxID=1754190 RepID=A0A1Y2EPR6_9FUNG|nr:hypothetical protein LY90DRAFT_666662 [Neocallimastix californiae]|eukprot:ORY73580.1 hypothetical protein LY90DRAFT_666662 [Neocallimastix californiae]